MGDAGEFLRCGEDKPTLHGDFILKNAKDELVHGYGVVWRVRARLFRQTLLNRRQKRQATRSLY